VTVPEIIVKEVQERGSVQSYVAEETCTTTKSNLPLLETPHNPFGSCMSSNS
jgi:hypothetical protein